MDRIFLYCALIIWLFNYYNLNNQYKKQSIILDNSINNDIVHYRGSIDNDLHSIAAITFSNHETMGLISNRDGNYVLGKIENDVDGKSKEVLRELLNEPNVIFE